MMKLATGVCTLIIILPAAQSKATSKSNLRGSDFPAADLHVDNISDESVDIIRQLTNTTDEDVDCHPYDLKWDELTSQQKDAARDLSYNRHKWDDDTALDPSAIRHDYWIDAPSGETELTNTERNAAILLGYNEGESQPWNQSKCACVSVLVSFKIFFNIVFTNHFVGHCLFPKHIFQDLGRTFMRIMTGPNCQHRDRTMKMSRLQPRIWDSPKRLGIPISPFPQIIWTGRISPHRSRRLQ